MKKRIKVRALHKSGSMFLYKYFKKLSEDNGLNFYSKNNNPSNDQDYEKKGYGVLCPLRKFEKVEEEDHLIVQVRNPLDILVSQFYSFGYMHNLKGTKKGTGSWPGIKDRSRIQKLGLDKYCLEESKTLKERLSLLPSLMNDDRVLVLSYFNMVYDFASWNKKVVNHLKIESQVNKLHEDFKHEFEHFSELKPSQIISGTAKSHKRKIYPGDAFYKLKNSTIIFLEEYFNEELEIIDSLKSKFALKKHIQILSKDINKLYFPGSYLTRSENRAMARVTKLSNVNLNEENFVEIEGWAFLEDSLSKASNVFAIVNKRKLPVRYGLKSSFLVEKYGSEKVGNCKFKVLVKKSYFGKTDNELKIRVEDESNGEFFISRKYYVSIDKENVKDAIYTLQ